MSKDIVTVRNLDTGKVGKVRRRIAEHPVFGLRLEVVPGGSKDLISLDELVQRNRVEPEPVFEENYEEDD